MVWQRAGTVSVQNGSTTVTGTGVDFAASSRVGDSFVGPDGATYEVANVASATVISILPAYRGATVSGASYAIMPVQGYDKMLSDAFNSLNNQFGPKLAALGTTGNYDILPVAKGGTGRTSLGNSVGSDLVASATDFTAGRLLTVGYGGLGGDSASYPSTSATDATVVSGAYLVSSGISGMPYAGFWGMRVERIFGNYCLHDVWDVNDANARYFSVANNGVFLGWNKYYHSGNTTRAADGTLKAV